ncbi:MAG: NAD-dependent epimerase/dehydratase family protein [Paracoccaceae bacterium]
MVVTGAGGKLGRLLRAAWREAPPAGVRPIWAGRGQCVDLHWDLLQDPPPRLPPGCQVLHLAGVVRGDDPALARNLAMVDPLLQVCRDAQVTRLFFASTAAVYRPGIRPGREDDVAAPVSAYGRSKLAAEERLLRQDAIAVTALRIGNVAGADALLGRRPEGAEIVLDPVARQPDGPLRSWLGGLHLADILPRLLQMPDLPPRLNLAVGPPFGMADLLRASGLPWRFGPPNPAVIPVAVMDTQRLSRLLPPMETTARQLAEQAAWARGVLA